MMLFKERMQALAWWDKVRSDPRAKQAATRWRAWSGAALDVVYPRACAQCGAAPDALPFLCWECLSDLHYVQPPFCSRCGDPVPGHIDHEYCCTYCTRQPPAFDLARSAVRYEGTAGIAIRDVKYHGATWRIPDLVHLLDGCLQTHYALLTFDGVCYVPLYPAKQRERGFNQAEWLARVLARTYGWPVIRNGLRRIKDTGSQTYLTAAQRAANVARVFEVPQPRKVEGRRLLLVDDVMTTGATVNACADQLRRAGAAAVHVLTVARG